MDTGSPGVEGTKSKSRTFNAARYATPLHFSSSMHHEISQASRHLVFPEVRYNRWLHFLFSVWATKILNFGILFSLNNGQEGRCSSWKRHHKVSFPHLHFELWPLCVCDFAIPSNEVSRQDFSANSALAFGVPSNIGNPGNPLLCPLYWNCARALLCDCIRGRPWFRVTHSEVDAILVFLVS